MIFERVSQLCTEHGSSITALCKEITGSSGNLQTWKKDNFKSEIIPQICKKFNVTSDYLLGLTDCQKPENVNIQEETGLSEAAIERLKSFNKKDYFTGGHALEYISKILTAPPFQILLMEIRKFDKVKHSQARFLDADSPVQKAADEAVSRAFGDEAEIVCGHDLRQLTLFNIHNRTDEIVNLVTSTKDDLTIDIDFNADSKLNSIIYLRHALQPVSAGSGVYLSEECMEKIRVKFDMQTARADFCVTVSGDSMEPKFHDGDILLVHEQPDVEKGEFGIFVINDEGYVKQRGEQKLISLNPNYENIPFHPDDDIICSGKVVGVLDKSLLV